MQLMLPPTASNHLPPRVRQTPIHTARRQYLLSSDMHIVFVLVERVAPEGEPVPVTRQGTLWLLDRLALPEARQGLGVICRMSTPNSKRTFFSWIKISIIELIPQLQP